MQISTMNQHFVTVVIRQNETIAEKMKKCQKHANTDFRFFLFFQKLQLSLKYHSNTTQLSLRFSTITQKMKKKKNMTDFCINCMTYFRLQTNISSTNTKSGGQHVGFLELLSRTSSYIRRFFSALWWHSIAYFFVFCLQFFEVQHHGFSTATTKSKLERHEAWHWSICQQSMFLGGVLLSFYFRLLPLLYHTY